MINDLRLPLPSDKQQMHHQQQQSHEETLQELVSSDTPPSEMQKYFSRRHLAIITQPIYISDRFYHLKGDLFVRYNLGSLWWCNIVFFSTTGVSLNREMCFADTGFQFLPAGASLSLCHCQADEIIYSLTQDLCTFDPQQDGEISCSNFYSKLWKDTVEKRQVCSAGRSPSVKQFWEARLAN